MALTDIRLQSYRSYQDSSFELSTTTNIVVGPNAAGKTNLLEALLLIANSTAYRGNSGLIRAGQNWARIDAHTEENELRTIKITNQNPTRTYELNGRSYNRMPTGGKMPVILFEPSHLSLLQNEPAGRREYIDAAIAQVDHSYSKHVVSYKRALLQRNSLLKSNLKDQSQLFVWGLRLSELAQKIVEQRLNMIDKINTTLSEKYSEIAAKKFAAKMEYVSDADRDNYSAWLLKKLENNIEEDVRRGFTSHGPHRHDFELHIDGSPASISASRGEVRTLILSLKVIQSALLEQTSGKKPLFLLDDVFGELDGARRKALTRYLKKYQSVITTTDADIVLKNFSRNCQIIPL